MSRIKVYIIRRLNFKEHILKKPKLNHIINLIMFLYILSLYLFTFQEGLNAISNIIALILIGLIWSKHVFIYKKIVINKFLIIYLFFIAISMASVVFAIDSNTSVVKVRTLVLLFVLMG